VKKSLSGATQGKNTDDYGQKNLPATPHSDRTSPHIILFNKVTTSGHGKAEIISSTFKKKMRGPGQIEG